MGLCVGDRIEVAIPKDNWERGYQPCPNGTGGEVVGFGKIYYGRGNGSKRPGKYLNRHWPRVLLDTGDTIQISCCFVVTTDTTGRREADDLMPCSKAEKERDFVEPLPDLPLWEGDVVRLDRWAGRYEECCITSIHYEYIGKFCDDGITPMPLYSVSPLGHEGISTSVREDDLELIRRGNYWKEAHGEPLEFADLKEEGEFAKSMGHAHEMRNPSCGLYKWYIDEALAAVHSGIAHGIVVNSSIMGLGPSISVYVFDDKELGKRVAKATLHGFSERLEKMGLNIPK